MKDDGEYIEGIDYKLHRRERATELEVKFHNFQTGRTETITKKLSSEGYKVLLNELMCLIE